MNFGEVWITNEPMAAQSLIDKCQTCLCIEDDWFMTHYLNTQICINKEDCEKPLVANSWPIFKVKGSMDKWDRRDHNPRGGFLNFFFGVGESSKTSKC